jgi:mevalonate kinase
MSDKHTNQHVGYGKLIIFGEHFVVYNKPAFVGAVSALTSCTVELSSAGWSTGVVVEDDRPAVPGYKDEKRDEMLVSTGECEAATPPCVSERTLVDRPCAEALRL